MSPVLLAILLVALGAAWAMWTQAIGSGWSPTPMRIVKLMLEVAGVGPSDVVYDLGCGDGRIIVAASKIYGARSVGIEADPIRYLISLLRVRALGLKGKVRVIYGNFFNVNLSEATVVTLFLQPGTNARLEPKLASELRSGARVVSYVWRLDGWAPALEDKSHQVYLYVIGRGTGTSAQDQKGKREGP